MGLITALLMQLGQMLLVIAVAPGVTGLVRKMKARLQRRIGPSILQPYRDLRRLFGKEVVLPQNTSWLFRMAPYVIFAATWVATSMVPTFETGLLFSWSGDLIAIVAMLGVARFVLALAALDTGTSFGGIGASREVMIASLAEPAMIMITFIVALIAGSTQLTTIAVTMTTAGLRVSLAMALVAMVIVALAENARIPFDNPATHLELTMVHEAMVLEYAGPRLALVEWAAGMRLTVLLALLANLFAPWGIAGGQPSAIDIVVGVAAVVAKVAVLAGLLATVEVFVAKLRLFRVPELLAGSFLLALLAVTAANFFTVSA